MSTGNTQGIYTAMDTFLESDLSELTNLSLDGAIFAASNMCVDGLISTACQTFEKTELAKIEKLNLTGGIFAVNGMSQEGTVETAVFTFGETKFPNLKELNLSETVFATSNMISSGTVEVAIDTFARFEITDKFAKLYLPTDYDEELGEWYGTFSNNSPYTNPITIYGDEEASWEWFNVNWWPNATWTE
ncbi:MAG: hypothetical protein LBC44_01955 [Mycoplasmataceae bacterium]|nr:hypothetical protein [Mycoplasmataceae bacterium]